MYLLDTNVISETRKPRPHGGVIEWFRTRKDEKVYLPAVVFGELQFGVQKTKRQDRRKAIEIENWISEMEEAFEVIPMKAAEFREWARLMDRKPHQITRDAMVAATARIHRLTVVTRNIRDFEHFEVDMFNPFQYRPESD